MIIIANTNSEDILNTNLLESDLCKKHTVLLSRNPLNVCVSFNSMLKEAENHGEMIGVCTHQDVFFPSEFESQLNDSIKRIESFDPNWAILGVGGGAVIKKVPMVVVHLMEHHRFISNMQQVPFNTPLQVVTLDELLLVINLKHKLRFDENLGHHLCGADICLQSQVQGLCCYLINAVCHHKRNELRPPNGYELNEKFHQAKEYIKTKWKDKLPIPTTCILIN